MANKLLNLKLYYQGKELDNARYGRDFTNKLFIGSNKYLAWQILDPKFPNKHLFLVNKGGNFYLRLPEKNDVNCKKADQEVDTAYLKKNSILNGNELLLAKDMTGTIVLSPQWSVTYEYAEPWVTIWTPEQKQIISQYSRRPKLTDFEKKNLWVMILITMIAFIVMLTYDLLNPVQVEANDLDSRLKDYKQTALKTSINTVSDFTQEEVIPEAKGKEAAKGTGQATTAGNTGAGSAKSVLANKFGIEAFDASETSAGQLVQYDYTQKLVGTSRGGGRRGGSGSGPGASGSGSGSGAAISGNSGTAFDPNEVSSSGAGYSAIAGSGIKGSSLKPSSSTNITKYTAGMGKIIPIGSPAQLSSAELRAKSQYSTGGLKTRSVSNIAEAPEEERSQLSNISSIVGAKQSQIKAAFNTASANQEMYGTLKIILYINENGQVEVAEVTVVSGSFYEGFTQEVRNICMAWKFKGGSKQKYEFTVICRK